MYLGEYYVLNKYFIALLTKSPKRLGNKSDKKKIRNMIA